MIPREKIAQFSSAPPLNKFNKAARFPPDFSVSALRNHLETRVTLALLRRLLFCFRLRLLCRSSLRLRFLRLLRRLIDILRARRGLSCCRLAHRDRATGLLDLCFGRFAYLVRFDLQRVLQFAVSQNFYAGHVATNEV